MKRGTTPTHVFTLPFDVGTVKAMQIIYEQKQGEEEAVTLMKSKSDCTLSGNTVTLRLTQEETLKFAYGFPVRIQMRVLTNSDDALTSRIMTVRVEDCLSDEVLT